LRLDTKYWGIIDLPRQKDYPGQTTYRKRSVLPPKLQTDIVKLSKAIDSDRDVGANLSSYIIGIRELPADVIVRASAEIQTIGSLYRRSADAGDWLWHFKQLGRYVAIPEAEISVLARFPQLAELYVFHADGRLREAALRAWHDPPDNPFSFAAIVYRLNDWVHQVRDAACDCANRLFPNVSAGIIGEASFFLFTQTQHWGRWGVRGRHILGTALYRRDVMQVLADLLKGRRPGQVGAVLRQALSQPSLDDVLPMLAREAALPHVRAIAYETLIFRRAQWRVGYQYEWIDKRYFLRRRTPKLERRPLDHRLDVEKLIVDAAQDRAVVVRKVAADGLIYLRNDLSSEMIQVGRLLLRDKASSVRSRSEFFLNKATRD
jgi:hypothetical protein